MRISHRRQADNIVEKKRMWNRRLQSDEQIHRFEHEQTAGNVIYYTLQLHKDVLSKETTTTMHY